MALPLPNLDDITFNQLMEEAKSIIPQYSKNWTDFSPSDPGVMLLELFAWINEMIIYRQNKISHKLKWELLKLLMPAPQTAFVDFEFKRLAHDYILPSGMKLQSENLKGDVVSFFLPEKTRVKARENDMSATQKIRLYASGTEPLQLKIKIILEDSSERFYTVPLLSSLNKENLNKYGHLPLLYHSDFIRRGNPYCITMDFKPFLSILDQDSTELNVVGEFVEDLLELENNPNGFTFDYHKREIVFTKEFVSKYEHKELYVHNLYLGGGSDAIISPNSSWEMIEGTNLEGVTPSEICFSNPVRAEDGEDWFLGEKDEILDEETMDDDLIKSAIRRNLDYHRPPYFRTITYDDYISAVKNAYAGNTSVEQAWCMPNYNIHENNSLGSEIDQSTNHVSVLIMNSLIYSDMKEQCSHEATNHLDLTRKYREMLTAVDRYMQRRRQIATIVHIGLPSPVPLKLSFNVTLLKSMRVPYDVVKTKIKSRIDSYFNPISGGREGNGLKPGRTISKSEISALVERIDFIDSIENLEFEVSQENSYSRVESIELKPNEIPVIPNRIPPVKDGCINCEEPVTITVEL